MFDIESEAGTHLPAYEVSNPSVSDLTLEDQIRFGINHWCAEDSLGRPFYGRTQEEAQKIRADYFAQ